MNEINNYNNEINNEQNVRSIIASNLTKYRKNLGLTQLELAEKLNYSDKTLSKWERGESIPDIVTLKQLASIFGVSVDVLISEEGTSTAFVRKKDKKPPTRRKIICVNLLSVALVWLVAVFIFVLLSLILKDQCKLWLSFIYAIPVSGIVLLVFSCIWGNNIYRFLFTSLIVWTSSLSVHLTMNLFNVQNGYMLYFISIVLEIMAFVFFIILKKNKKN